MECVEDFLPVSGGTIAYSTRYCPVELGKINGQSDPEPGAGQTWRAKVPLLTDHVPFLQVCCVFCYSSPNHSFRMALRIHDAVLNRLLIVANHVNEVAWVRSLLTNFMRILRTESLSGSPHHCGGHD